MDEDTVLYKLFTVGLESLGDTIKMLSSPGVRVSPAMWDYLQKEQKQFLIQTLQAVDKNLLGVFDDLKSANEKHKESIKNDN